MVRNILKLLLRTWVGAVLFSLIGTFIGYLFFVQHLGWHNMSAILGLLAAWIIIIAVNIYHKWE